MFYKTETDQFFSEVEFPVDGNCVYQACYTRLIALQLDLGPTVTDLASFRKKISDELTLAVNSALPGRQQQYREAITNELREMIDCGIGPQTPQKVALSTQLESYGEALQQALQYFMQQKKAKPDDKELNEEIDTWLNDSGIELYLHDVTLDKTWGSYVQLSIIHELYGVQIDVLRVKNSDTDKHLLHRIQRFEGDPAKLIELIHTHGDTHYNGLIPISTEAYAKLLAEEKTRQEAEKIAKAKAKAKEPKKEAEEEITLENMPDIVKRLLGMVTSLSHQVYDLQEFCLQQYPTAPSGYPFRAPVFASTSSASALPTFGRPLTFSFGSLGNSPRLASTSLTSPPSLDYLAEEDYLPQEDEQDTTELDTAPLNLARSSGKKPSP